MRLTQVKECVRHFRTGSNQPGISSGTIPRLKSLTQKPHGLIVGSKGPLRKRQRPLSLRRGNRSSCPIAAFRPSQAGLPLDAVT
jgi:hypothetical protein